MAMAMARARFTDTLRARSPLAYWGPLIKLSSCQIGRLPRVEGDYGRDR